jgi:4-diphosphocytidyl-2-C-methyl-D-erythritol kinase
MIIREFAPAKINLALHVLGRRADGYHELDSIVAFASVGDELTLTLADNTSLTVSGPFAADVPTGPENLVLKAHAALAAEFQVPPVALHLTKNLPVASGIGGGSSDAAAALRGILKLTKQGIDFSSLQKLSLSLGADVPVCLQAHACRMQGVGEIIMELERLPTTAALLVNPAKSCGTADVFRKIGLAAGDSFGTALDASTPENWRNDMTAAAIAVLPEIGLVLSALSALVPHATVRMSGSGATCFALFDSLDEAEAVGAALASKHQDWWIAPVTLT